MKDPLELVEMSTLLAAAKGRSEIIIGMIDGPVQTSHPDLREAKISIVSSGSGVTCQMAESPACLHGTFVSGILSAKRGSDAPAISPGCTLLVRPIFCEAIDLRQCPIVTPQHLASAITQTVEAGAKVINLSLGLGSTALEDHPDLRESFDYAFAKGVLLVGAAGNHGRIGCVPLFNHAWLIPVVACDLQGRAQPSSNLGPSIGKRGLMAPGVGITSLSSSGGYTKMSGTSVAAPFVTGVIALLWSLFPKAKAENLRQAILLPGTPRRNIVPPLMNAAASWQVLRASN